MDAVLAFVAQYGLPGLASLLLGWLYWHERARNERLVEKRTDDLKDQLLTVTNALNDNSSTLAELTALIRSGSGRA